MKHAETIGNGVQASEAEVLEGSEDGRFPHSNARGRGKLSEPKWIVPPRLSRSEVPKMEAVRSPGRWTQDVLPTDSAKLSVSKIAGS
jgi:hypothetical protein